MVPLGFQEAICSMVGSSIGANNIALARKISKLTYIISHSICLLISVFVFVFRNTIAHIFTTDEEVQSILLFILVINAILFVPDSAAGILSGTVRALGHQGKAVKFLLISYWCIGFPVALLCAFKFNMKSPGLWIGCTTSVTFQAMSFLRVILQADWQKIAD